MNSKLPPKALGIDFGTTNTVAAVSAPDGDTQLVQFGPAASASAVFRSALCFWEDERAWQGIAHEAGPWAIEEYLQSPLDCRFIQSFKSVAASPLFERAMIYNRPHRFEDLGRTFLNRLVSHAQGALDTRPASVIVGRPVEYAGARADALLARQRYDLMFEALGTQPLYVFEPLGAAHSYATRLDKPATILVADFGGGTTDFSVVTIAEPGAARRCVPLASAGIAIAGDHFDYRIVDHLVLPLLGKGSQYRSFGKVLDIPGGHFSDFGNWSRLAMMRNRRTLDELRRLQRDALFPDQIGRMIALIENEQGFALYDAIGKLKRALSETETARFAFAGGGVEIEAEVLRSQFEQWIATDLLRIEAAMNTALERAGMTTGAIDRVFLTGGSSLIPAIRGLFERRFGSDRIATGGELTSIAHGLALIGMEDDPSQWGE
ncbi:Hsp70 family protein [Blastomonas aquatica]|uniref:Molecular chaperone DnaK n=1 Tax=Blastomonas aquatica TaxID=1510276 RepID=A0ABQ1JA74_9SPHN|nr:Hsp70 family protein [Blastomonas aquatica]GGB62293.1 molecular chaperone DnaK [Blastomonas aquatica]